jgi:hypothetical protein
MGRAIAWIKGLGVGAGLMYFYDPDLGRRRRAGLRDGLGHAVHGLNDFVARGSHDLGNRAYGLASELGTMFDAEVPDDRVLVERVRARLGRVVSHPRAVAVSADRGRVTLAGPILAGEAGPLVCAVAAVRGVSAVDDRLEVHDRPGGLPSLQGGVPRADVRGGLGDGPGDWSPAAQLLAGAAGGLLAIRVARLGGPVALAVAAGGLALAARGGLGASRGSGRGGPEPGGRQQSLTSSQL